MYQQKSVKVFDTWQRSVTLPCHQQNFKFCLCNQMTKHHWSHGALQMQYLLFSTITQQAELRILLIIETKQNWILNKMKEPYDSFQSEIYLVTRTSKFIGWNGEHTPHCSNELKVPEKRADSTVQKFQSKLNPDLTTMSFHSSENWTWRRHIFHGISSSCFLLLLNLSIHLCIPQQSLLCWNQWWQRPLDLAHKYTYNMFSFFCLYLYLNTVNIKLWLTYTQFKRAVIWLRSFIVLNLSAKKLYKCNLFTTHSTYL